MRLCSQCQRPPAGRLGAIRPARLIAASVAAVVLGVFSLAITAPPASAKPACWKQIIDDWVDDGVIQNVYPLHCYGEAIKHVPNDLQQYTGIVDDINAARQRASRVRTLAVTHQRPAPADVSPHDPDSSVYNSAIDRLGPTNSDSMPLPLLILASLALIMVAAGAVGLATRHLRARKTPA
jgi:hypothetical protein